MQSARSMQIGLGFCRIGAAIAWQQLVTINHRTGVAGPEVAATCPSCDLRVPGA